MEAKLTPDQSRALSASGDDRLTVVDPETNRRYVLVDYVTIAMLDSLNAIRNGIAEMESGKGQPLAEAMAEIRSQLTNRR